MDIIDKLCLAVQQFPTIFDCLNITKMTKINMVTPQSRQSTKLSVQSSEFGIRTSTRPTASQAGECLSHPPPFGSGGGGRGGDIT